MSITADCVERLELRRETSTRRRIASFVVCSWLCLTGATALEAQYKPTEADRQLEKRMEQTDRQIKEAEKILEKFEREDQAAKKQADEAKQRQQARRLNSKLMFGAICLVLSIAFRVFKNSKQ